MFEKHKVGYVLESGSALGAQRHNGLIPWDDDLDISVHNDFNKILLNEVAKDLGKHVLTIVPTKFFELVRLCTFEF